MKTPVGVLGVCHDDGIRRRHGLPLERIRRLLESFRPDVICGEVLPAAWERYRGNRDERGYWGEPASEYWELVFPWADATGTAFEPIDWVELDVWHDFDPFRPYAEPERGRLEAEWERWWARQLATTRTGLPFNSEAYDIVTRAKYAWLERVNREAYLFRWECRHLIMLQRIRNALARHAGKRVLCIVGADHNYMLADGLSESDDVALAYPLIEDDGES